MFGMVHQQEPVLKLNYQSLTSGPTHQTTPAITLHSVAGTQSPATYNYRNFVLRRCYASSLGKKNDK